MIKRIITAIAALVAFVPILVWDNIIVTTSVFALIAGVSAYEMLSCCKLNKNLFISLPGVLVTAACIFVPVVFGLRIFAAASAMLAAVVCALLYFMGIAVFGHKSVDAGSLFMGFSLITYIAAGFTALSALYTIFGVWAVAFVLCVSWCTDTFAYFSGMLFGKGFDANLRKVPAIQSDYIFAFIGVYHHRPVVLVMI